MRGSDGFASRTKPIFSPPECTFHLGFGLVNLGEAALAVDPLAGRLIPTNLLHLQRRCKRRR